jgi:hypothetical protein
MTGFATAQVSSQALRDACIPVGPALVKLSEWVFTPERRCVNNVFAPCWGIVTNAAMPIPMFTSSEKWIAVAFDSEGTARLILPGCKVHAILPTDRLAREPNHDVWFLP